MDTCNCSSTQTQESSDEKYFSSYENVEIHRLMIQDRPRTDAYKDAILKNKHLFEGKLVMDVGAGTGILSLFAALAGAQKIYAVEASTLAKCIPDIAKANGYANVIEVFETKVENLDLQSDLRVDVLISEWMGFYLFHESMLSSVLYARDRFLSDEGTIFPTEAKLYACPCSLTNYYKDQFYFWENVYGFNMSPIKDIAYLSKQTKPEIYQISPSDLLSEPVCIKTLNLLYTTEEEIESFSCKTFVGIHQSGNFQGVALWFKCDFDGRDYDSEGEEFGAVVSLSTSPFDPVTHWKQTVIVLGPLRKIHTPDFNKADKDENPTPSEEEADESFVEKDEVVGWELTFAKEEGEQRNYTITLEMLDPEEEDHPVPCSCPMPRCLIIAKMIEKQEEMELEESAVEN